MNVADAIARVLKEEGIRYLVCYPRQLLIDARAAIDIKPIDEALSGWLDKAAAAALRQSGVL